jgi:hypothetical protein
MNEITSNRRRMEYGNNGLIDLFCLFLGDDMKVKNVYYYK